MVPLVNHAFAYATPAIFVIFRRFLTGFEQQSPCFTGWNVTSSFSLFSSQPPLFGGTEAWFTKGTVFWTLTEEMTPPPQKNTETTL